MKGEGTFVRGSINHFQEIFTRNVGLFLEILRMTVQHAPNHTRREKHVGSKRISALLVLDRSRRFTTKPKINAHAIPTTMMGIIMKPNRSVSSTSSIHPPPCRGTFAHAYPDGNTNSIKRRSNQLPCIPLKEHRGRESVDGLVL